MTADHMLTLATAQSRSEARALLKGLREVFVTGPAGVELQVTKASVAKAIRDQQTCRGWHLRHDLERGPRVGVMEPCHDHRACTKELDYD